MNSRKVFLMRNLFQRSANAKVFVKFRAFFGHAKVSALKVIILYFF